VIVYGQPLPLCTSLTNVIIGLPSQLSVAVARLGFSAGTSLKQLTEIALGQPVMVGGVVSGGVLIVCVQLA
jgi:hypothetical protein